MDFITKTKKYFRFRYRLYKSGKKRILYGKNNVIQNLGYRYKFNYKIVGDNNSVFINELSELSDINLFVVGNNNSVRIGKQCAIKGRTLWIEGNNCLIDIGDNVNIIDAEIMAVEDNSKIKIEKNCLLSYGVEIKTSDSHSIIDRESGGRINPAQDVILKENAWIGSRACILKGVTIGKDSIVGAGSIVTKDVPDFCVVAGNPASVIKENVSWSMEQI